MKLKLTTDKVLITGIVLLLLFIVTIIVVSISESKKVNVTAKLVTHTHEVLIQSGKLLSFIIDNETGSRDYLLTGQKIFLEPLIKSQKGIYYQLTQLKLLTSDNPAQQIRIDSLSIYITKRIAFSNHSISVSELKGAEAAKTIVKTGEGKSYTDRIRRIINEMQSAENVLLVQHKEAKEKKIVNLNKILISVIVSILILLGILIQKIRTDFSVKTKAIALAKLNTELEQQVLERAAELVKSKNILSEIFERITDGFVALDKHWRYTYINKKAEEFFKHDPGQMIGRDIWSEFPEIVNQPFYKACHQSIETQQYICMEDYYSPLGLWFETHIYPSPDGLSVFYRDITEKKKAELKIKIANERFYTVSTATNDVIWDWNLLTDELWWNNNFFTQFGYDTHLTPSDITSWTNGIYSDDKERVLEKIHKTIDSGEKYWSDEYRYLKKDGSIVFVYDRGFVLHDELGKPNRMIGSIQDITERKKAELKIKKANEGFEMISRATNDAVFELDLLTGESRHNEAFLLLFNSGIAVGNVKSNIELWKSKLHPNDKERVINKLKTAFTGSSSTWADEFRFQKADGSYGAFYDRAFITRDESGKAISMIGSLIDISELKKVEEQLKESELNYRSLIEQATDTIYIADASMKYIDINASGCRMFGYSKEEFLKLAPADLVFEEDITITPLQTEELTSEKTIRYERRLKRKDGTAVEVETNGKMLEDGRFVMFVRDISERKKIEDEIKKSNSQLTLSQQIAHIGYWEMDLINQSNYWSDELYRLFDLENDGKVMDLDTYMKNVHPDDRKLLLESHYAAIENNQQLNVEFRFVKKNGNIRNFHTIGDVKTDKNGKPRKIEGTTQDITERKKIEDENLKEKYLSDTIINSLPGIFYLYTRDGKFLRGNKNFETISKYGADEIRKMHPMDFIDEDEKELVSQKINNVFILGEENVQANFMLKTKEKIPYYFTGIAIEYEGNTCLLGVGIDVSERVEAQEKIKQTSEQLRQLAGHLQTIREEERKRIGREIHDELGQQLTAIKMDVAWIDKKIAGETTVVKNKLKNVIQLLDGSNESIRRILSELRPGILDDYGLLEAMEWLGRQFTANTGIPVKFTTVAIEIKSLELIATCIFRVYQEALTNITRYAQANKVSTSVSIVGETIMVIIEDDGKGFIIESVENKKTFGILGMKERVLLLGGKCELVSSPGKGTKIIIKLPYPISKLI